MFEDEYQNMLKEVTGKNKRIIMIITTQTRGFLSRKYINSDKDLNHVDKVV